MLQHLAGGRVDLMLGRGNTVPVYPWFGQDIRQGLPARARALTTCCIGYGARTLSTGREPSARRCKASRRSPPTRRVPPFVWHERDPHAGDRRAGRLLRQRLLRE